MNTLDIIQTTSWTNEICFSDSWMVEIADRSRPAQLPVSYIVSADSAKGAYYAVVSTLPLNLFVTKSPEKINE